MDAVYRFATPDDALAAIPAWQRANWQRQIERARSGPDWSDLIDRAVVAAEDRELYPEDYAMRDQRLADAFAREAAFINNKQKAA